MQNIRSWDICMQNIRSWDLSPNLWVFAWSTCRERLIILAGLIDPERIRGRTSGPVTSNHFVLHRTQLVPSPTSM
jgi:hypothetical protein